MDKQLLKKYFYNLKLFHKLINSMENSKLKANYVVELDLDISEYDYDDFKTIDDVQNICKDKINWHFGDLISLDSYRDTWTYLIGKEGKLIVNGCYDGGAGYLTVPYQITKYLNDATTKYKNIELMYLDSIDLRFDDKFLENYFGNFQKEWDFTYTWFYQEDNLTINFGKENSLNFEISLKDQEKWMEFKRCDNSLNEECINLIKEFFNAVDDTNLLKYFHILTF